MTQPVASVERPRVVVRLHGGLGNQLFQIAAGLKVCGILDVSPQSLYLNTRYLGSYETARDFDAQFIVQHINGLSAGDRSGLLASLVEKARLGRLLNQSFCSIAAISTVDAINVNVLKGSRLVVLDGYFQSLACQFSEDVRAQLQLRLSASDEACLSSQLGMRIGLHIRRGDYVSSKSASQVFRVLPLEFYRKALRLLVGRGVVLVYSDDATLAKQFASEVGGITRSGIGLSARQEFLELMSCESYIISNSTFSWWASNLGYGEGKITVAPARWYKDADRNRRNGLLDSRFLILDE
jgi:hypothetical protein